MKHLATGYKYGMSVFTHLDRHCYWSHSGSAAYAYEHSQHCMWLCSKLPLAMCSSMHKGCCTCMMHKDYNFSYI